MLVLSANVIAPTHIIAEGEGRGGEGEGAEAAGNTRGTLCRGSDCLTTMLYTGTNAK